MHFFSVCAQSTQIITWNKKINGSRMCGFWLTLCFQLLSPPDGFLVCVCPHPFLIPLNLYSSFPIGLLFLPPLLYSERLDLVTLWPCLIWGELAPQNQIFSLWLITIILELVKVFSSFLSCHTLGKQWWCSSYSKQSLFNPFIHNYYFCQKYKTS